ncbi:MAG: hypothetical protein AVDCRST_MAG87-841 [uncultured Thermomicrobiales bacterium]|uniref:Uncharacterized protein n=1 Tax=uncultured Thermomicrobiales bacterium TaxID=1645740 RepID=A0A6J4UIZ9_9BACT|nr:MAG: hypothetical protein AVDCRST_MAG87-841 [uncultured Thermomicrobiales bacterium]
MLLLLAGLGGQLGGDRVECRLALEKFAVGEFVRADGSVDVPTPDQGDP